MSVSPTEPTSSSPATEPAQESALTKQVIPPLTVKQFFILIVLLMVGILAAIGMIYGQVQMDDIVKVFMSILGMAAGSVLLGRNN